MSPTIFNPGGGLPLDGGTLTGDLKLDGAKVTIKDAGGAYEDAISISSDVVQFGDAGHQTSILGSATPYFNDGSDTYNLWNDLSPQTVRQVPVQTISSTTLAATSLGGAVVSTGQSNFFRIYLVWYSPAASDLDISMVGPSGGSGEFAVWERGTGNMTAMDDTKWPLDGGAVRGSFIWGWWKSDGTAGNINLKAALNTSSGNATIYNTSVMLTQNTNEWPVGV